MNSEENNMELEENNMEPEQVDVVNNRRRGEILYYTINQVANLLGQDEGSILYFTNVFDDILNIKISDKELTYTDKDIDKLEFLIGLKNKGLTIKEIQKYCEGLSFEGEKSVIAKEEVPMVSTEDISETISKVQNEQFDNLKEYIDNKISENNELLSQNIAKLIEEAQEKQFKSLKEELLSEINSKFEAQPNSNAELNEEAYTKLDKLITEKLSTENGLKEEFEKLSEMYISREENIIEEIRKYRTIMSQAYSLEQEMDKTKPGFLSKIFSGNDK